MLETHSHNIYEMRSPVLLSRWRRHPLKPNSFCFNICHYGTNLTNRCAFYDHHLLHLKMGYVEWLPCPFSFIYITQTRRKIESMKLYWVSDKHFDVIVKEIHFFTHITAWKTEKRRHLDFFFTLFIDITCPFRYFETSTSSILLSAVSWVSPLHLFCFGIIFVTYIKFI